MNSTRAVAAILALRWTGLATVNGIPDCRTRLCRDCTSRNGDSQLTISHPLAGWGAQRLPDDHHSSRTGKGGNWDGVVSATGTYRSSNTVVITGHESTLTGEDTTGDGN
ncbi:hypothetical protein ElyMa_005175600 [Elysia marginata]|uniref:Secreted protein n=1 Tax=Elysia marginata TaxID=1093978 RepID=A0AAV4JT11_9GAST|nr:hypothetical protein ElyMa_005175600 [Elysia marginata]